MLLIKIKKPSNPKCKIVPKKKSATKGPTNGFKVSSEWPFCNSKTVLKMKSRNRHFQPKKCKNAKQRTIQLPLPGFPSVEPPGSPPLEDPSPRSDKIHHYYSLLLHQKFVGEKILERRDPQMVLQKRFAFKIFDFSLVDF